MTQDKEHNPQCQIWQSKYYYGWGSSVPPVCSCHQAPKEPDTNERKLEMKPTYLTSCLCFWQSLGRALGWTTDGVHKREVKDSYLCIKCSQNHWKNHWHRFLDYLADGKSAEDFFKDLLSTKKD